MALKKWTGWLSLLLALSILLLLNLLANDLFKQHRIDLTENQQYTLTLGSENILAALDEPVTLRFYLSEKLATQLPAISPYANQVKELLQEYARKSGGKLQLLQIDPEPLTEAEDEALAYGLQGVPISQNQVFYFGLVGNGTNNQQQVITFLSPDRQAQIEYDLSKLIYQLTQNKKPTVGLLTSLSMLGGNSPMALSSQPVAPWVVVEQLQQLFDVVEVDATAKQINAEIDVLLIAYAGELAMPMRYAVDQFMLNGGRALIFTDAMAEIAASTAPITGLGGATDTAMQDMLRAWGIAISPGVVAADLSRALRIQTNQKGRNVVMQYPVWMTLRASEMEQADIVTAEINQLTLLTPGIIEVQPREAISVTPLLQTTTQGAVIDQLVLGLGLAVEQAVDPQALLKDYQPAEQALLLGVRISGLLASQFADTPPDDVDLAEGTEHLTIASKPANVILVADVDMLQDRAWVQVQNLFGSRIAIPNAGNGAFVVNAIENLLGSSDLISVRSRGLIERPFTLIEDITQKAEQDYRHTEQTLMVQLEQAEAKLLALQEQGPGLSLGQADGQLSLNPAQLDEMARFRQQKISVRKELRDVRHALRKDIEQVERLTKMVNIGLMPLLVALFGAIFIMLRLRGQRQT